MEIAVLKEINLVSKVVTDVDGLSFLPLQKQEKIKTTKKYIPQLLKLKPEAHRLVLICVRCSCISRNKFTCD